MQPQPTPPVVVQSRLNTHFVGSTGINSIYIFVALHIVTLILDHSIKDAGNIWRLIFDTIDQYVTAPGLVLGGLAAYKGRPDSVQQTDAQQAAAAVASGGPLPITPASLSV